VCFNVIVSANSEANVADTDFDALYLRELPYLIALGTTLSGDRDVGADLAHEALLRTYRQWSKVAALDRPGAWTRRVLINLATDSHRRGQRESKGLRRLETQPKQPQSEVSSDQFWTAVRTLPERQRTAVALHYLEDMSIKDIAAVMEVSEGTIKISLFMARKKLAMLLDVEDGNK
jgi:RNA polymerase sigma-70 factor, ECF subfamily